MRILHILLVLTASFAYLTSARAATATDLVYMEAQGEPAENGKILKMIFRETERNPEQSIAQVTFESGGSVSSSLFVIKGFCKIAKSRKSKYFRKLSESENSNGLWIYTVGFAKTRTGSSLKIPTPHDRNPDEDEEVLSTRDCKLLESL
jgi:hypothetical protein